MNKKIIIGGLLGLALLSPLALRAQTVDEVKAQLIQQLLTLIAELQAQLDELIAAQGGSVNTTANSNLVKGTNGIDVYATDKKIADVGEAFEDQVKKLAKNGGTFDQAALDKLAAGVGTVALLGESVSGRVGEKITVSGQSLSGSITVHFSDDYSLKNQSSFLNKVTFTMPNIPKGTYDLVVSTSAGVSNSINLIVQ